MATPVTEIELKYLTIFSAERGMKLQAESIFLVSCLHQTSTAGRTVGDTTQKLETS
jgi:hypothetical protein